MIKIERLIPLLRDGWVAMDEDGRWYYYRRKPICRGSFWLGGFNVGKNPFYRYFDIKPVKDWTKSLIEIKDGRIASYAVCGGGVNENL